MDNFVPVLSNKVIDLIDAAAGSQTAASVGVTFFSKLQVFGVKALYARDYKMTATAPPVDHILSRVSPPGWESLYSERRFENINYLPREVKRRSNPFQWSDAILHSPAERELAQALIDLGFPDGLAVPCHGPGIEVGLVSLAFERLPAVSPSDRAAIELASVFLHAQMRGLNPPPKLSNAALSPRERECIAFVSEGRSDGDIASILSISETTVLTHVQNAKRKLSCKTRAQAVALCVAHGIL